MLAPILHDKFMEQLRASRLRVPYYSSVWSSSALQSFVRAIEKVRGQSVDEEGRCILHKKEGVDEQEHHNTSAGDARDVHADDPVDEEIINQDKNNHEPQQEHKNYKHEDTTLGATWKNLLEPRHYLEHWRKVGYTLVDEKDEFLPHDAASGGKIDTSYTGAGSEADDGKRSVSEVDPRRLKLRPDAKPGVVSSASVFQLHHEQVFDASCPGGDRKILPPAAAGSKNPGSNVVSAKNKKSLKKGKASSNTNNINQEHQLRQKSTSPALGAAKTAMHSQGNIDPKILFPAKAKAPRPPCPVFSAAEAQFLWLSGVRPSLFRSVLPFADRSNRLALVRYYLTGRLTVGDKVLKEVRQRKTHPMRTSISTSSAPASSSCSTGAASSGPCAASSWGTASASSSSGSKAKQSLSTTPKAVATGAGPAAPPTTTSKSTSTFEVGSLTMWNRPENAPEKRDSKSALAVVNIGTLCGEFIGSGRPANLDVTDLFTINRMVALAELRKNLREGAVQIQMWFLQSLLQPVNSTSREADVPPPDDHSDVDHDDLGAVEEGGGPAATGPSKCDDEKLFQPTPEREGGQLRREEEDKKGTGQQNSDLPTFSKEIYSSSCAATVHSATKNKKKASGYYPPTISELHKAQILSIFQALKPATVNWNSLMDRFLDMDDFHRFARKCTSAQSTRSSTSVQQASSCASSPSPGAGAAAAVIKNTSSTASTCPARIYCAHSGHSFRWAQETFGACIQDYFAPPCKRLLLPPEEQIKRLQLDAESLGAARDLQEQVHKTNHEFGEKLLEENANVSHMLDELGIAEVATCIIALRTHLQ